MSDLEQKVRTALLTASAAAPSTGGLARAARRRARRRRRTLVAASVTGMVTVVAVPVALALAADAPRGTGGPVAPDPGIPAASQPPDGWRTVEWEGLRLQVPGGWADGARSAWCVVDGGPEAPVVETPETIAAMIDCGEPRVGLGLTIAEVDGGRDAVTEPRQLEPPVGEPAQTLPGSWVAQWRHDGLLVTVNTADEETAARVLATITDSGPATGPVVEHQGVTVQLPLGWVELDDGACDIGSAPRYGPEGSDPCRPEENLAFYASATFDPAAGPGIHRSPDGGWAGYTHAGDVVVWVAAREREVVEQVFDSLR